MPLRRGPPHARRIMGHLGSLEFLFGRTGWGYFQRGMAKFWSYWPSPRQLIDSRPLVLVVSIYKLYVVQTICEVRGKHILCDSPFSWCAHVCANCPRNSLLKRPCFLFFGPPFMDTLRFPSKTLTKRVSIYSTFALKGDLTPCGHDSQPDAAWDCTAQDTKRLLRLLSFKFELEESRRWLRDGCLESFDQREQILRKRSMSWKNVSSWNLIKYHSAISAIINGWLFPNIIINKPLTLTSITYHHSLIISKH